MNRHHVHELSNGRKSHMEHFTKTVTHHLANSFMTGDSKMFKTIWKNLFIIYIVLLLNFVVIKFNGDISSLINTN